MNVEDTLLEKLPLAVVMRVESSFGFVRGRMLLAGSEGWVGQDEGPDLMRDYVGPQTQLGWFGTKVKMCGVGREERASLTSSNRTQICFGMGTNEQGAREGAFLVGCSWSPGAVAMVILPQVFGTGSEGHGRCYMETLNFGPYS